MRTNKIFSFARFMNVMKYDLGSNWKGYCYQYLTITGVFLFCYLLGFFFLGTMRISVSGENLVSNIPLFIGGAMSVVTPFFFYLGAGRILKVMRTKEGREAFLMLPATRLEKFISRAMISTFGVLLLVVLGAISADLLRFVFHPMFFLPDSMSQLYFPTFLSEMFSSPFSLFQDEPKNIADNISLFVSFEWISLAIILWVHSLFILGGTVFVKHPIVKIFCILFLGFFVLTNLVINLDSIEGIIEGIISLPVKDGVLFTNVMTVIFFALFIFNWWFSYHLFSRAQIIRKKIF